MKIVSCAHLKKIKMNRFLKVVSAFALVATIAACKKEDDNVTFVPPRDYTVQYATEKTQIEEYLQTHYIASVDADFNVDIQEIDPDAAEPQVSIWDQTVYPLLNKEVSLNGVLYKVYYISLREGSGEAPTKLDNVLVAYRGNLLDQSEFTNEPFPQSVLPLSQSIEGWQEIIPLFKAGIYTDIPGDPNPPTYEDYGAGIMFLPSDLAYYNATQPGIPSYSPLVFSFKLYDVDYVDHDGDGLLSKDETVPGVDPLDYDTDSDGDANFVDTDDDGDAFLTKFEIKDPATGLPYVVIPTCTGGTLPKHLDPACH
jgi:hypothetical protein